MNFEKIEIDDNFKEMFLAVLDSSSISAKIKEEIVKDFFCLRTNTINTIGGKK
jgi:CRISPR/Cas system CMR-associated protein Cmr3 (group 5 of RAMP superfamily)